jgi:hypothetical protein
VLLLLLQWVCIHCTLSIVPRWTAVHGNVRDICCLQDELASKACRNAIHARLASAGKIQASSVLVALIFGGSDVTIATNQSDSQQTGLVSQDSHNDKGLQGCSALATKLQPLVQALLQEGRLGSDFAWPLLRIVLATGEAADESAARAAAQLLVLVPAAPEHVKAVHKHAVSQPDWAPGLCSIVAGGIRKFLPRTSGVLLSHLMSSCG